MEKIRFQTPETPVSAHGVGETIVSSSRSVVDGTQGLGEKLRGTTEASQSEVNEEIERLLQRADIMSSGIPDSADKESLERFLNYLQGRTEAMVSTISIAQHAAMLANMIKSYGEGIQGNMIVNGLLTEEAKEALKNLKVDFSNDSKTGEL